jgi:hypothetical protein
MPRYAFLKLDEFGEVEFPPEFLNRARQADEQAIDRIVKAIGGKHVPRGLDRQALCSDIADAYYRRDHAFDLYKGSTAQRDLKHLRRVRHTAAKLLGLLRRDTRVEAMIGAMISAAPTAGVGPHPPRQSPIDLLNQLLDAVARVERVRAHAAEEWRTAHKRDSVLRGRRPTGTEWLAGVSLPLVFERHLQKPARRSRTKEGAPAGPLIQFVRVVLKELQLTYADESIMRAITRLAPFRETRNRNMPSATGASQTRAR